MGQSAEVRESADLRRILALPRRPLDLEAARAQARAWTQLLALVTGVALRPWQGFALTEVAENKGGYIVLSVGAGKTLLTWLIAVVLQARAPLLVAPGGLRQKTFDDFRSFVGKWRAPSPPPKVVSFDELTSAANVDLLERRQPDVLIKDESHKSRNMDASIHKRLNRYIYEYEPTVIELTATPSRHSLMDFGPQMIWALGNRAPLPVNEKELR